MRISLPIHNDKVSMHFGQCDEFAFVDVDNDTKTVVRTARLVPPAHEPGLLPRWLHEQGSDLIITGDMGQQARQLFVENGIEVVVGASPDTPEQVVSAFLSGSLVLGQLSRREVKES